MTDAQFLFSALVAVTVILFGLHVIVRAVYDFGEDVGAEWGKRKDEAVDVDWWW